jgi:membrane fusion protein (multidrug efflux system)
MRQAQGKGNVTLSQTDKASVQVALPDGTPYDQQGTLDFSDTSVNPSTGAVNLRALVPNPAHRLLPGMYVTLKARLGEQHGVFLVPQPAVLRDTVGAYVLAVGKDGKVVRHDVALGSMSGSSWIVTSGLAAGEQVIVSGVQNAKEGTPAKPSPWRPQASPAGAHSTAPAAASAPAAHGK